MCSEVSPDGPEGLPFPPSNLLSPEPRQPVGITPAWEAQAPTGHHGPQSRGCVTIMTSIGAGRQNYRHSMRRSYEGPWRSLLKRASWGCKQTKKIICNNRSTSVYWIKNKNNGRSRHCWGGAGNKGIPTNSPWPQGTSNLTLIKEL